jgi:hypothetical protein
MENMKTNDVMDELSLAQMSIENDGPDCAEEPIDMFFLNRIKEAYAPFISEEKILSGFNVDWAQGNIYKKDVLKAAGFAFSNSEHGQVLTLTVRNKSFAPVPVSFHKSVVLPSGFPRTIRPNGSVSYTFINYKGTIFAEAINGI